MIKNKISNITNLAAITALTAVENKIPNVSNLVKKTYDIKISEIENNIAKDHVHNKYITTQELLPILKIRYFEKKDRF